MIATFGVNWFAACSQVRPFAAAGTVSQDGAGAKPPLYRTSVPGAIVHAPLKSFWVEKSGFAGHGLPLLPASPRTQPNAKLTESPTTSTSCGSVGGGGGGPPMQAASVPPASRTPATRSENLRKRLSCPARGANTNSGILDTRVSLSRHHPPGVPGALLSRGCLARIRAPIVPR